MRIVLISWLTLDGVTQSPARADEDVRGGFRYGGWAVPYGDTQLMSRGGSTREGSGLLLGRRTYDDFASVWPKRSNNPYTDVLNKTTKYVVSNTLREPLPWINSVLISGDATQSVAALKNKAGGDLTMIGSTLLAEALMRHNLIDEYLLAIHPLVLGSGRRLFPEHWYSRLRLLETRSTTTGVIIARYQPADQMNEAVNAPP